MIIRENLLLWIVVILFAFSSATQLFYYIYFYLAVIQHKHAVRNSEKKPVSVIICARNEANNLTTFLPAVLEQDYPDFEVIVVNDCSEDNSSDVLGEFLKRYPRLKVSILNRDIKFTHNKKFAQFIGIKAATNDILLFTDADCKPESDKWIESMVSNFEEDTDFVLGYGGFFSGRGILNKYIRYETMTIALQYFGMTLRGFPYMGVGRNLAYRRSVFFKNNGFGSHNHVISGDDDLFVNKNANTQNTRVELRNIAHTMSVPAVKWTEWFIRKQRHLTTSRYYKSGDKFRLITEPASRIIFYTSFVILLSQLFLWQAVLTVFGIRLIVQSVIFVKGQKKFKEKDLTAYSLIFDIFSPVINCVVYMSNIIKGQRKYRWK